MTNGRLISPAEAANCNPITRRAVGFTPYSGGSVSAAGNVEETPRPVPTAAAHRTTRDSHIKKQSDDAEAAIPRIRAAVASYRYAGRYRVWPGPNSNTFAAHVIRDARLGCALPPHALGKDFKHGRGCAQLAPSARRESTDP